MIISASRRTDIPKFFSEWMENRIKEGFVDVRNPYYTSQVSRYSLSPDVVDGIVFWTKDPGPMISRLSSFDAYNFYFQFSLTPYGKDIEGNLPDKHDLIKTFKELSTRIGSDRVIWRFDPILLNSKYDTDYVIHSFKSIATELSGFTQQVIISFVDEYKFGERNTYTASNTRGVSITNQNQIAQQIAQIAQAKGMAVGTCAETINLSKYGIEHARCVDGRIFEKLGNYKLSRLKSRYEVLAKDPSQRKECLCVDSIDIGSLNTCMNGCKYCYATSKNEIKLQENLRSYDPASTLLCGELKEDDKLTDHRGSNDSKDRSYRFDEKARSKT